MVDETPVVLLSSQFEYLNLPAFSDQCNCACADSGFTFGIRPHQTSDLYRQANLHSQRLRSGQTLLFNPVWDSGVAVLNEPAREIWNEFALPQPLPTQSGPKITAVTQMITAGLLMPAGAIMQPHRRPPKTLSAWVHVTNECNLRCDYCYIRKSDEEMSEETGFAAVDAIVRSAVKGQFHGIKLKFAGGEATLNLKLVFALHAYAQEQAALNGLVLGTVILSNGVSIGEKAIAEFVSRGMEVMISLDGLGEYHDTQRQFANGRGSFAWTSRTIDRLLTQGIRPFISITVSDRNTDGLPDVIAYVLERSLPFNINFYRDNECATPFENLQLREDRLITAMHRTFDVIEANLPDFSLLGSLADRAQFNQPHEKTCGVGESYLVVDHKGNVAKCHMEIEKPITTVLAEDPLALIRAEQIGIQNVSVEEKEGCRECEWRYWCAGGCPLLTYRATSRYDVKSPYCHIYKAVYPRLLRLEGLRLLKLETRTKGEAQGNTLP